MNFDYGCELQIWFDEPRARVHHCAVAGVVLQLSSRLRLSFIDDAGGWLTNASLDDALLDYSFIAMVSLKRIDDGLIFRDGSDR